MPRPRPASAAPAPDADGVPARRAALRILDSVLRRGLTMDSAAHDHAKGLPAADAALASAIAGETLRRLPDLDRWIDGATRQPLPDDSKARMVLRLALAQVVGLRTPDHAVVATALPLVDGGPRRLVHGVLGTLLRGQRPDLSVPHLPAAVEQRWQAAWGQAMVDAARRQLGARPLLDLSFVSEVASANFAQGTALAPRHRRLAEVAGGVTSLPGFDAGQWWVQDLAASLPARLVPLDASRVIDACAAPGGKTLQLAAAGHEVLALDRSAVRLRRLADNLARTGLSAKVVTADILDFAPDAPVDAVLLDAPCSATGTFRRHPEVLYRATSRVIADLADVQARLLDRVAGWVRPGGSLVYATCSLEPEEGEEQAAAFLARHPQWRLQPPPPLVAGVVSPDPRWLRVLPGMLDEAGGLDGFFTAHLVLDA